MKFRPNVISCWKSTLVKILYLVHMFSVAKMANVQIDLNCFNYVNSDQKNDRKNSHNQLNMKKICQKSVFFFRQNYDSQGLWNTSLALGQRTCPWHAICEALFSRCNFSFSKIKSPIKGWVPLKGGLILSMEKVKKNRRSY